MVHRYWKYSYLFYIVRNFDHSNSVMMLVVDGVIRYLELEGTDNDNLLNTTWYVVCPHPTYVTHWCLHKHPCPVYLYGAFADGSHNKLAQTKRNYASYGLINWYSLIVVTQLYCCVTIDWLVIVCGQCMYYLITMMFCDCFVDITLYIWPVQNSVCTC